MLSLNTTYDKKLVEKRKKLLINLKIQRDVVSFKTHYTVEASCALGQCKAIFKIMSDYTAKNKKIKNL